MPVSYRVSAAPHTSTVINQKPHLLPKCHLETELKMEFGAIQRPEYIFLFLNLLDGAYSWLHCS